MNLQELAVGNFILPVDTHTPGEVLIVEPGAVQLHNRPNADDERDLEGIVLNKDWLFQLGFQYKPLKSVWEYYSENKALGIRIRQIGNNFQFDIYKIRYVHQLQNLIKALLG